jgi:type IV pilus assembly protein PilX
MKRDNTHRSGSRFGRESGAILVISLLILLGMTLIGVSSMDSAIMELKMAATMQQQVVAMSRAEATLITAETTIDTLTSDGAVWNFETDSDGFYPGMNELDVAQADWSSFDAETGPVNTDDGVDNDDSYIIEYLGAKPIPGETVKKDTNGVIVGGAVHTFLNTSRSSSGRSVVRIVQSIYVTLAAP